MQVFSTTRTRHDMTILCTMSFCAMHCMKRTALHIVISIASRDLAFSRCLSGTDDIIGAFRHTQSIDSWNDLYKSQTRNTFTYIASHCVYTPLSVALSSKSGPTFSLGRSSPSPRSRTLTYAATQPQVALVCRY